MHMVLYGLLASLRWWVGFIVAVVSPIAFILGIVLAVLGGRKYARYIHDARLLAEKGKISTLPAVLFIVFIIAFNVAVYVFTTLLMLPLRIVVGGFNIFSIVTPIIYSVAIILISYKYFSHRYRGVKHLLTREARLVEKASRVLEPVDKLDEMRKKLLGK